MLIFSPIFSSFIRRTQLSLQHQISIFTIICTEDSTISTKSVAMGLILQNCRPQEWLCHYFFLWNKFVLSEEILVSRLYELWLRIFWFLTENTNSKKMSTLIFPIHFFLPVGSHLWQVNSWKRLIFSHLRRMASWKRVTRMDLGQVRSS